jgi:hypothetical protein
MNIESLISQANPVPLAHVADGDSPHAQRTLTQVMAAEHSEAVAGHGKPARATHGGRSGRGAAGTLLRVAAGLTVAAAAAALVITQLAPRGHEGRRNAAVPRASASTHPSTAKAAWGSLSLVAHAQPLEPAPGPGQFEYTDSSSLN